MARESFLVLMGAAGVVIGLLAALRPAVLLASKGVEPRGPVLVWTRETGVLIFAQSIAVLLVHQAPDSPALKAVFWGNVVAHAALLPIELQAWRAGLIPRRAGIVPNTLLHALAAFGFARCALG